jgi:outer membrane protein
MPNPGETSARWPKASPNYRCLFVFIVFPAFWLAAMMPAYGDQTTALTGMDLEKTVDLALEANISARISSQRTRAADAVVKARQTEFLPTFSTQYNYTRNDEPRFSVIPTLGVVQPEEEYAWVTSVTQPLFTGFALTHQYQLAKLGLDSARLNEALIRQDIVFDAKRVYFLLLQAQKLEVVAQEAVTMLEAQTEVAVNYHDVGMTPLNDLLKTKVELANARQDLVAAQNNLEIARADFNLLLRRPIGTSVTPVDILDFAPLSRSLAECLETAETDRLEVAVADLDIQIREKEVALAKKDYYPARFRFKVIITSWARTGRWTVVRELTTAVSGMFRPRPGGISGSGAKPDHGVAEKKSNLAEARLTPHRTAGQHPETGQAGLAQGR